jgi:hypothetical protein
VLVLHAPGLKASDLAQLDDASAIRSAFSRATTDERLHLPYLEPGKQPLDVALQRLPCSRSNDVEVLTLRDFEGVKVDRRRALRSLGGSGVRRLMISEVTC